MLANLSTSSKKKKKNETTKESSDTVTMTAVSLTPGRLMASPTGRKSSGRCASNNNAKDREAQKSMQRMKIENLGKFFSFSSLHISSITA